MAKSAYGINKSVVGVDPWGGRSKATPIDHSGPASYTTGGEVFPQQSTLGGPNSVGLNGVYWVNGGTSESGTYRVFPVFGGNGAVKGTIKLQWWTISSDTQVSGSTDLSAEVIRLLVIGG